MSRLAGYGGAVFVSQQVIHACDVVFDEYVDAGCTITADATDYKVGAASLKMVQDAGLNNTEIIATDSIAALNLVTPNAYSALYCWAKCSVGVATGTYRVLLDDVASCPAPQAEFDIPALVANVWKFCQCALATGTWAASTAIISVGVRLQANDPAACTLWIDAINVAKTIAGIRGWTIDETMDVVDVTSFQDGGHKTFIPTLDGWSGSFDGFKDGAPLAIGTEIALELRESSTSTQQWRGSAILTGRHPNVSVDGAVIYTYDFLGNHKLEAPTT